MLAEIALTFIIFVHIGYPVMLLLLAYGKPRPDGGTWWGPVTVVIAARNEAERIGFKIANLRSQDYPDAMRIIVVSDGSTDATAAEAAIAGAEVVELPEHQGRAAAHNAAMELVRTDVVVFTDAETILGAGSLTALVRVFSQPDVGCAVGNLRYYAGAGSESAHHDEWEVRVQRAESRLGLLANGCGAFMALRRGCLAPLAPWEDIDTTLVLRTRGMLSPFEYRVILAEDAVATDIAPSTLRGVLRARYRSAAKTTKSLMRPSWDTRTLQRMLLPHVVMRRPLRYVTFTAALLLLGDFLLTGHWVPVLILLGVMLLNRHATSALIGANAGCFAGLLGRAPAVHEPTRRAGR